VFFKLQLYNTKRISHIIILHFLCRKVWIAIFYPMKVTDEWNCWRKQSCHSWL